MDDWDENFKGPHWNLLANGEWATANFKPCISCVNKSVTVNYITFLLCSQQHFNCVIKWWMIMNSFYIVNDKSYQKQNIGFIILVSSHDHLLSNHLGKMGMFPSLRVNILVWPISRKLQWLLLAASAPIILCGVRAKTNTPIGHIMLVLQTSFQIILLPAKAKKKNMCVYGHPTYPNFC